MASCVVKRMIRLSSIKTGYPRRIGVLFVVLGLLAGCDRSKNNQVQGYVEGEFVYIASPLAGKLTTLNVQRGAQVRAGDALFALDSAPETAQRDEAERRVEQARKQVEDARKGKRPSEIESLEAQLKQLQAALTFSESDVVRAERLVKPKITSVEDYEQKVSIRDQDRQRVSQLQAELKTAKLGSRADFIAAAEEEVQARLAVLAKTEWDLSQKQQAAPQAGLVFDTLYRQGEWVAAGRPIISLLPPANIKVRAFVPEPRIGAVRQGDSVRVKVDGVPEPFTGKVSYISPRAEFTPPVIYSQQTRGKLVFLVEIVFDAETAAKLHPGQPVDVEWDN